MNNIAGQTAKPERQARPEEKQSPHDNADSAKNQKGPSEFAEWVHKPSLKLLCDEVKTGRRTSRELALQKYGRSKCCAPSRQSFKSWSDQFVASEKVADLKCRGIRRVRAMRDIGANAGAQIMANGARRCLLRVGGPHSIAPLCDGPLRLQDHCDNFAGTHEIGQLAKKWPLPVHGIKSAGFVFGQTHGSDGDDAKARLMNTRKNFALQAAANRVRLDNCKRTFECQDSFLQKIFVKIIASLRVTMRTRVDYFNAAATVDPRSAGVSTQRIPAAPIAAYLSFAVPCPPLMIAPA